MTSTAGRIAASMAVKRHKVNKLQLELIEKSADIISLSHGLNGLVTGKLDLSFKPALKELIDRLEEEEE